MLSPSRGGPFSSNGEAPEGSGGGVGKSACGRCSAGRDGSSRILGTKGAATLLGVTGSVGVGLSGECMVVGGLLCFVSTVQLKGWNRSLQDLVLSRAGESGVSPSSLKPGGLFLFSALRSCAGSPVACAGMALVLPMNLTGVLPRDRNFNLNHTCGLRSLRPRGSQGAPNLEGRGPSRPQGRQPCRIPDRATQTGNLPFPRGRT